MLKMKKSDGTWEEIYGAEHNVESTEVGSVMTYAGAAVPYGYLSCDGQAVSRTTYAELFNVIGTIWGTGDGSTTFNLPKLNDNRFLEGASAAGNLKDAGLPNITGYLGLVADNWPGGGAFRWSSTSERITTNKHVVPDTDTNYTPMFDASKSNSIYGKSTTVQPKSATVKYCIRFTKSVSTNLTMTEIKKAIVDMMYPIGARYVQMAGMPEPSTLGGAWEVDTSYNGKALWADSTKALGTSIDAALPNIRGQFSNERFGWYYGGSASGAFSETATGDLAGANYDNGNKAKVLKFNANKSNSIYKDSATTVQPPAITCKVWKRTA